MNLMLSIETGIYGGSLALFQDRNFIDGSAATDNVSSAEKVLAGIESLLSKHDLQKDKIKKIVLSGEPGSITGIRIGTAIALGLKKTLACDLVSVSALNALISVFGERENNYNRRPSIIAAVPVGRNQVAALNSKLKSNDYNGKSVRAALTEENLVGSFEEFIKTVRSAPDDTKIILHDKLYRELGLNSDCEISMSDNIVNAGSNLAAINGLEALNHS